MAGSLKLTEFEQYVLGKTWGIDELATRNEGAVIAGFERFCEKELVELVLKSGDPSPIGGIIARLATTWNANIVNAVVTRETELRTKETTELSETLQKEREFWNKEMIRNEEELTRTKDALKQESALKEEAMRNVQHWKEWAVKINESLIDHQTSMRWVIQNSPTVISHLDGGLMVGEF